MTLLGNTCIHVPVEVLRESPPLLPPPPRRDQDLPTKRHQLLKYIQKAMLFLYRFK